MDRATRSAAVRRAYDALSLDAAVLAKVASPDLVLHIPGSHPLAGDYHGLADIGRYVKQTWAVASCDRPYTVLSVFCDDDDDLVLTECSASHGTPPFVRMVVHVLRFEGPHLVEVWEKPFDTDAENAFWRTAYGVRMPAQRATRGVSATLDPVPPLRHPDSDR